MSNNYPLCIFGAKLKYPQTISCIRWENIRVFWRVKNVNLVIRLDSASSQNPVKEKKKHCQWSSTIKVCNQNEVFSILGVDVIHIWFLSSCCNCFHVTNLITNRIFCEFYIRNCPKPYHNHKHETNIAVQISTSTILSNCDSFQFSVLSL